VDLRKLLNLMQDISEYLKDDEDWELRAELAEELGYLLTDLEDYVDVKDAQKLDNFN